ncbi:hypothetical protein OS493_018930 [Desmophyllum pertusum]|uniref:Uncharacterized protein n=1 Tax=Desmophyllum pertusum TaxID=174260 RepID=A0A9W9YZR2_9CNID|nr:hypothetical protein OS493_018930 [Desmophyllum pertusum]
MAWVFVTSKKNAKQAKKCFEEKGQYDKERKITKCSEDEVMIPIKQALAEQIKCEQTGTEKSFVVSL